MTVIIVNLRMQFPFSFSLFMFGFFICKANTELSSSKWFHNIYSPLCIFGERKCNVTKSSTGVLDIWNRTRWLIIRVKLSLYSNGRYVYDHATCESARSLILPLSRITKLRLIGPTSLNIFSRSWSFVEKGRFRTNSTFSETAEPSFTLLSSLRSAAMLDCWGYLTSLIQSLWASVTSAAIAGADNF